MRYAGFFSVKRSDILIHFLSVSPRALPELGFRTEGGSLSRKSIKLDDLCLSNSLQVHVFVSIKESKVLRILRHSHHHF